MKLWIILPFKVLFLPVGEVFGATDVKFPVKGIPSYVGDHKFACDF